MSSNKRNGRWARGVGTAVGAAFAAALIGLANAPVAGADEGSAVDTAVDNFLQGIANDFPVEVNELTVLDPDAVCMLPPCIETLSDDLMEGFNMAVNTAFQPEGPIDGFFDQLLGGLSVPAADPAQALDIQVSISGLDLFPTAGNTATATSNLGDIAVAIGNGANAQAIGAVFDSAFAVGTNSTAEANATAEAGGGIGDFAFADGANSIAEAGGAASAFGGAGSFDSALVFGADSTAQALSVPPILPTGIGEPAFFDLAAVVGADSFARAGPLDFDLAAVFGNMLTATALGFGTVDIAP